MKTQMRLRSLGRTRRNILLALSSFTLMLMVTSLFNSDTPARIKAGDAKTAVNVSPADSPQKQDGAKKPQSGTKATNLAGYKVHIDPVTGKITSPPPGQVAPEQSAELQNSLSTSSEGLVEVQSPVAGGGIILDLKGRFQDAMVGTIEADGKVTAECGTTLRVPAKSKPSSTSTTGSKKGKE